MQARRNYKTADMRRKLIKRTYQSTTPIVNIKIINLNGYRPRPKLNQTIFDGDFVRDSKKPLFRPSYKQEDMSDS